MDGGIDLNRELVRERTSTLLIRVSGQAMVGSGIGHAGWLGDVEGWTRAIDELGAIADTLAAAARFRVFFLQSSLRIVLAFWLHE
ncbi:hypothetical protein [Citricoccus sp.]|uniref:hypothetical protein n=1 Tax=Citricoccus sp. TaxID=1978372 RepID=UPI0028BD39B8|nr:hypothetical protein [Citricoccus sp.]